MKTDEKTANHAKTYVRSCHPEKVLRTQNFLRNFIKNFFPETCNGNM